MGQTEGARTQDVQRESKWTPPRSCSTSPPSSLMGTLCPCAWVRAWVICPGLLPGSDRGLLQQSQKDGGLCWFPSTELFLNSLTLTGAHLPGFLSSTSSPIPGTLVHTSWLFGLSPTPCHSTFSTPNCSNWLHLFSYLHLSLTQSPDPHLPPSPTWASLSQPLLGAHRLLVPSDRGDPKIPSQLWFLSPRDSQAKNRS